MNSRSLRWLLVILPVAAAAVWLWWPQPQALPVTPASAPASPVAAKKAVLKPAVATSFSASTASRAFALFSAHAATNTVASLHATNKFPWRLANTAKSLRELSHDPHAILLANALIDTRGQLDLNLPKNLQAKGDPGAYIVQANGTINSGFRAALTLAGAQIVSYIPNNAYLVQASASQAATIASSGLTVLPYEPYYKVSSGLIGQAATGQPLPPETLLNVGAFASDGSAVQTEIQNLGGIIVAQDTSPFGPVYRVSPPADWTALAQLPGVQVVEPTYRRMPANDISREDLGVSADTLTNANYLDLYGSNVVVEVNDTGIQYQNAQFSLGGSPMNTGSGTRVSGDSLGSLQDFSGHGTFVAGVIAGNGANSWSPTNVGVYASGSISNADFRGKAPLASLFSVGAFGGNDTPYNIAAGTYNPDIFDTSDYYLQTAAVSLTNALISNNSWTYGGDNQYDLAAASYDAAVRDALPTATGSQPVLFIFAAGDDGGGNDDGSGASADSIESPATAKNVVTVGALQQARDITNIVTAADGSSNAVWLAETESSSLVADYSARGNVGIGVEGDGGRFKPDLVAPGNFVVSTRSSEWDQAAYYDPTNYVAYGYPPQVVTLGAYNDLSVGVPYNAVAMTITVSPNAQSPQPFPNNIPIYVSSTLSNPGPGPSPASNDYSGFNSVSSPPGGGATYIDNLQQSFLVFSVGGSTNFSSTYQLNYDVTVTFTETNDQGNYFEVLSNLNDSLGPDYRYESGTSVSAPAVSGMAALIQDFFTNTLHFNPSPALLKGLLINGARAVGSYQFTLTNAPNDQGWGLPNLPNSLPAAWAGPLRASPPPTSGYIPPATNAFFFQDQSPTNALATGDSQTFQLSLSPGAQAQPLRVTLTWTDPPGDPAAGIKLVNNLDIVVTNMDTLTPTNVTVFYGNDFSTAGNPNYSVPETTNDVVIDMVNNVRNIFIQPTLGTNYSVTVVARSVNVNAVTAQTNSVVQDFALVISSGDGFSGVTNAFKLVSNPPVRNPTADEDITLVTTTNTPLLNQIAGENSPLLGTNTVGVGTNSLIGTNGQVTIGMTNQWHFYVVTNYLGYTNSAFITFFPLEMAVSRVGTLSDSVADATRPQGDIDLYVAKEPGLLNLDPVVISNCVNGVGGDAVSAGASGTEYVAYSNSVINQVYYIGIKSEDHLGTTYGFLPVFTAYPFSSLNADGSESINGLTLPVSIVPGTPKNPSQALVFALALYPLTIDELVVTNQIWHQNFGDLYGLLSHDNVNDILNNHDGYGDTIGSNALIYFDSPYNPISTPIGYVTVPTPHTSDGPGSLVSYQGQPVIGPWILTEADNAYVQTGSIVAFGLRAFPHYPANKGLDVYIAAGGEFSDYIDVPAGVTNMTLNVTNETLPTTTPPLIVYLKYGSAPTPVLNPTNYDQTVTVSNGLPPFVGGSISVGPTSIPPLNPGRYYYEIYNPDLINPATNVYIIATFGYQAVPSSQTFQSTSQSPLPDDAVATNTIVITNTESIYSTAVGVVIDHPRVSDLTLTLISPLNQRYTLVENRGGDTANMGHLDITTNFFGTTSSGGALGNTNVLGPVPNEGTLVVDYNMYTVPDNMDVYYDGVDIFHSGYISGAGQFIIPYGPGTDTNITIVMDQGGDPDSSSLWTYTPQVVSENYNYLTLTDNTNLAPELIKFAIPPFNLDDEGTNYILSNFEGSTNKDYFGPTNIVDAYGGWFVPAAVTNVTVNFTNSALLVTNITVYTNNLVSVVTDPATAYEGSNYLALGLGTITRNIATIPTRQYTVSYSYRGPGIAGWWRGEGNALDSANPETNGNNGELIGRFTFPEGEVGQAFGMEDQGNLYQFAGTNNYVQIPRAPGLDVGTGSGLTVEGWINPTNLYTQEPLVEWLSRIPTNAAVTNVAILAGPFLYRGTDHYYYLLDHTNWTTSEMWATNMGGHLVTIDNADEQNWVYDTFGNYGGTNRNLWIGLNDVTTEGNYTWTSGETPNYYNWVTGQPDNVCNGNERYTMMLGATNTTPSLWVLADQFGGYCTNSGYTLTATNGTYGVVELDTIPTNGVQFWVSVTNSPATGNSILSSNGCLYANLVDITNGFHEIWSAPGLVQSNIYQHVALTYNTNSGVATLYYNGTNVCSTNLGVFTPKTTGDVLLGKDMSLQTNNYYSGAMDEMSIYGRCLSDAEIASIYEISAWTTNNPGTNGQVVANGKFDPAYPPAIGLSVASVTLAGRNTVIVGDNTNWQRVNYTFVATSNLAPFQITGIAPGILLDDFTVTEAALGNLYYQPEEPLDGLVGESAAGTWTLEILDNRAGDTNALAKLVSWQLQFVLDTNNSTPITLYPEMPGTNTVPPGDIAYFYVPIPGWSHWATNILVSSSQNVEFLFNPTNPPTGTGPGDQVLLASGTSTGITPPVLQTTNPPVLPLTETNFYYLGVKNISGVPATVVVRVDFDITALTNGLPVPGTLTTNDAVRYFSFDVSTNNAQEATFQLLKLSGNADLVASYGTPLPNPTNFAYGSFNTTNSDQNIYIQTNSEPVPLTPGRWYLGVFRHDTGPVTYTVLAKELDAGQTNVINLTNNVPFRFTTGPGAALTNFFLFNVTNAAQNIHFELYDMTGNGDLTIQTNGLPLMPPFYASSQEPGLIPEYVYLRTNNVLTNLAGLWYLGVPNHETNEISFTILAVNDSLLITNTTPAFPGAVGAATYVSGGRGSTNVYHVTNLADDGSPGSLRYGINSFTNGANIVFDVSGNIALQSPLVITNSNLTIAGQTAPGDGITLQNYGTQLNGATNVIIRYLRFRPGVTSSQTLFFDDFNGPFLDSVWQTNLPANAVSGDQNEDATYLGAPDYGFETLATSSVLLLTNNLNNHQRVGWCTASSFTATNSFFYDVRFNSLVQSRTNSVDAFIEIWLIDAANSNRYDIVSPFEGEFATAPAFYAGSSIDGTYFFPGFTIVNNTWYHLVLQSSPGQNIRASLYNDSGQELIGYNFAHSGAAFPAGFRLGLSQSMGTPLQLAPSAVAVDYARLSTNPRATDSLNLTNASDVMVDHVSASWSPDALVSVLGSSNVTVQWSVMADSFYGTNVSGTQTNYLAGSGSVLRYGGGSLSFNHNLYADNYSASPLLGDNLVLDFVNNVVYNWGALPGLSLTNDPVADPNGSTNEMNYACNYVLAGLHSPTNYIAFWSGSTNTWVFQTNNFIDAYTNQTEVTNDLATNTVYILNGSDTGWAMFTTNTTEFGDPFPLPYLGVVNATIPTATAEEAYQAYEKVLDFAGDQASRDSVDLRLMRHVRTQSGTFISSQTQVGGWPALSSQPTPLDTDQDGVPDYWEITFGMNPTNAADGAIVNTNTGYSALETYLNWLAAPHALTVGTNPVGVDLYELAGRTGRLSFYVTNALNGTVMLTNDVVTNYFYTNGIYTNSVTTFTNRLAIFATTNNYTSSFTNPASFDVYITNNDTTAWFGPVTVSVVVSATNIFQLDPIIVLTNGVPFSVTNDPVYNFRTTDSPGAVLFQIYNLSGPATLVLQTNGVPVAPDYLATSGTARTNGVEILMVTNSALTGIGANVLGALNQNWYLGVNNGGTGTLSYTVVATEIPVSPNIITLTNNVPFSWTAGPGPDLTNFFRYSITNSADVVQFQLFNQSGNGDLTAQTNTLPFAPEYSAISQQPGNNPELIQEPAGAGSQWYLGVPNNDPVTINYTIEAQESASPSTVLTNSGPVTNTVGSGSVQYYLVQVPEFATVASNILASATGPLNLWYSTNVPPTIGQPDDVLLLQNVTSGIDVFDTNGTPQLVPGGYYYLGVENSVNSGAVTYSLEVEFGFAIPVSMAPTVVTVASTNTTAIGSTLLATVIPNGVTSTVYFAYGLTTNFSSFSTAEVVSSGLYSQDPIAIGVGGLAPATTYYFEAIATNEFGTNYGGVLTFTTAGGGPTVVTTPANNIASSGAELQAGVSPNGLVTTVYFEYGTSTSYGQFTGTQVITSSLNTTNQDIGLPASGLVPGTVYHYQAIAYNSAGTNYGGDLTFTSLAALPTVVTVNAVNLTATGATLQALVTPNGSPTAVYFEYGLTTSYGSLSGTNVLGGNLNTAQSVALNVSGLQPGVVYHFQAVGVNGAGTAYGGDLTFTVSAAGPTVVTLPATNLTIASVTLPALVTPNGAAAQVYFVYGTTKSHGSQTAVSVLNNNLTTAQLVTSSVSQLSPGVVYHYQAIAFNSVATNYGADLTFTNPAQPVTLSLVATNNGFLLSWYAPTNYQFKVQWSPTLATNQWSTFTNIVMYTGPVTPTNGLFTFFDNGSQSGGLGAIRFYQLELVIFSNAPAAPLVTTLPATNLTTGSVTLPALVTPNGATATVYFNWGLTTNYGNQTPVTVLADNLYSSQLVTSPLTGLLPGAIYHYQVVATNVAGLSQGIDLTFTNSIQLSFAITIVATNHGYLVEWYAPTNYEFNVEWATSLLGTYHTFTNLVVYTGPVTPTNGLFTFFDDGSQTGGFGPAGFYRVLALPGGPPPVLPASGSVYQINPLATLVVTNTATDLNPGAILSYVVSGSLTGTNMPVVATNNGVVTVIWTPTFAQAGMTNLITTVVTDRSTSISASNSFEVIVYPLPVFTGVVVSPNEGVFLQWTAVPQTQFQVGWTTNLLSPWTYVPAGPPYISSVTTNFSFVFPVTNTMTGMQFFRLREVP